MANLPETSTWEEGIYQLEPTDPVLGGEDRISNLQAKQLGNRTSYLKESLEQETGNRIQGDVNALESAKSYFKTRTATLTVPGIIQLSNAYNSQVQNLAATSKGTNPKPICPQRRWNPSTRP